MNAFRARVPVACSPPLVGRPDKPRADLPPSRRTLLRPQSGSFYAPAMEDRMPRNRGRRSGGWRHRHSRFARLGSMPRRSGSIRSQSSRYSNERGFAIAASETRQTRSPTGGAEGDSALIELGGFAASGLSLVRLGLAALKRRSSRGDQRPVHARNG